MIIEIIRKCLRPIIKIIYSHSNSRNPILINSFPKSGTHLLYQIIKWIPEHQDFKYFIASMPSLTQKERSINNIISKIDSIEPGEILRAHLFYNLIFVKHLDAKNIIHLLIYRDPRDVVISEANYLYDMNPFHRLHKYFKRFPDLSDRIMFSILGNDFCQTSVNYENIYNRFNRYKGWLECDSVFTVKYEDLVRTDREQVIKNIMSYYIKNSGRTNLDLNDLVSHAIENINPNKSHTFREGGTNKWKKYFNGEHKRVFKEIAGELLIELGYEKDFNW